ncbi:MAG TPA: hypothetical protein DIW28_09065 [Zetaproteobacteria bacterium]|nr:hypothetical protein [Zetaproteobacteria bacterium]
MAYSIHELNLMQLPGMPTTRQGWHNLVIRDKWEASTEKGRGKGGMRRVYTPPPDVMVLIEARQSGAMPSAPAAAPRTPAQQQEAVGIEEIDLPPAMPAKISGGAKCLGCGAFAGLIQIEGRIRLEFDSPGAITLMEIMVALQPVFKGDASALYDLSLRAYAVLSMLTAGNEDSIINLISKPGLVSTLAAFCEELNASPLHNHAPSEAKS